MSDFAQAGLFDHPYNSGCLSKRKCSKQLDTGRQVNKDTYNTSSYFHARGSYSLCLLYVLRNAKPYSFAMNSRRFHNGLALIVRPPVRKISNRSNRQQCKERIYTKCLFGFLRHIPTPRTNIFGKSITPRFQRRRHPEEQRRHNQRLRNPPSAVLTVTIRGSECHLQYPKAKYLLTRRAEFHGFTRG